MPPLHFKPLRLLLTAVFAAVLLFACQLNEPDPLLGEWKIVSMQLENEPTMFDNALANARIEFRKNGKYELTEAGMKEKGSWKKENGMLRIKPDGKEASETSYRILNLTTDSLVYSSDDEITVTTTLLKLGESAGESEYENYE